jgi:putative ABC transport system permease protein
MFKNYCKIAIRNLLRHKGISFINIFGLAVGMTCCLLIMLFVKDEVSYDRYHKDAGSIYRIVKDFVNDDGSRLPDATTPPALAPAMQNEIPGIEHVTRVFPGWTNKFTFKYGNKTFIEEKLFRVDSSFFDVFSFTFVKGDPKSALEKLTNIVITESTARKYFGDEDPMGKIIDGTNFGSFLVNGVIKDVPENSHFHFDFLVSMRKFAGNPDTNWDWYNFYTYVKLKRHTDIAAVEPQIQALYRRNVKEGTNIFYAQPVTSIHLTSQLKWELEPNSDKMYIYVFSIIALFVILIACINYINLTTARSSLRAKEIGVRKVSGAFKTSLVRQFLVESIFTALVSLGVALFLTALLTPVINQLSQKHLSLFAKENTGLLLIAAATSVVIGLIAGLYPAIYLSSFKPVLVLKGLKMPGGGVFNLRKALVVFQFTISVAMIAGTMIVMRQVSYIQKAKLGLNKDQVMIIESGGAFASVNNAEAFKNELMEMTAVKKLAGADGVIGGQNWTNTVRAKGAGREQLLNFLTVGYDYLDVMGIDVKEGRSFSKQYMGDTLQNGEPGTTERKSGSIIVNETAVKELGIPSPAIGQEIVWGEDADTTYNLKVVGVMKDFHFTSLRNEIKPFAFVVEPPRESLITVKLQSNDLSNTIAAIEKKWSKHSPRRPLQYSFMDETFARLYRSEERFKKVFIYITSLAMIIACLGLFGLAAFVTEQRTKEIGIRKVLGASVHGLVSLLSKDFMKLVLIAIILAIPATWYFMRQWLQDFAYRINISWWIFFVAGAAALLIALITVSFQAIKTAITNPVKSLRTE